MTVRITSEIGVLEHVICHEPGPELSVVTPRNASAYLFDDLLDEETSREEHRAFRAILDRFCKVSEVSDLLTQVLEIDEAREYMLARSEEGVREAAEGAQPAEIARLFIEGKRADIPPARGLTLSKLLNERGYLLPPLPNLFFTRDAACVIGDHALIAAMAHEVRWTEELIMRALFGFHPALATAGMIHDQVEKRRLNTSVECGDVHVLREDLLLVGLSERTSAAGIGLLAEAVFEKTKVRDVLVVLLPRERAAIHLDMIFTMLDRDLCCVYPPHFSGPTRLPVIHLSRGDDSAHERDALFPALHDVGLPLEPIFCGGPRRTQQEREQWGSGCNMFAVAPGQVIAYVRNDETIAALERDGGFRHVRAETLSATDDVPMDGRAVYTFRGSELVRGGGGPRCMTLPVLRRDVEW
ncbi:MAG: arginine deiminase family protein [Gemmatimonadota bacterium]|nr:arginine deiminase family protein [Gemmatimonadota bacterium]